MKLHRIFTCSLALTGVLAPLCATSARALDPGVRGAYAVSSSAYDFGDEALTPAGFPGPVEVRGSVHYPERLSDGPFPLVLLLHGRSITCRSGSSSRLAWPCPEGYQPVPSHEGFHYLADLLASHGLIVVSVSANGINARDNSTPDQGMHARSVLIDHHISLWESFNASGGGTFGSQFVGAVDTGTLGTMGHSRGGEGVIRNYLDSRESDGSSPVKALLALAPTNTERTLVTDVPFGVVLPYCDGDLSGLPGVYYFDDAVYQAEQDETPKYAFLMMGANHNFYNTAWASDDWRRADYWRRDEHCDAAHPNSQRLSNGLQQRAAAAYVSSFFRKHLLGEEAFAAILTGDDPVPPSASGSTVHASFHPPASRRLMLNRLDGEQNLEVSTVGGAVDSAGLYTYDICGGTTENRFCLEDTDRNLRQVPHNYPVFGARDVPGLTQLRMAWTRADTSTWYDNRIPAAHADFSAFDHLQFRACVDFELSAPGETQDFVVELVDGTGMAHGVRVGSVSDAFSYPPGTGYLVPTPRNVLRTVRVPLSAFEGVDLSDVQAVRFVFDETDDGSILVSELALSADAQAEPEPPGEPVIALQWCLGGG